MAAFDFAAPVAALIFDQASKVVLSFTDTDDAGHVLPYSGYGMRFALFVDESAVLLLCTVANGKIVVADTAPNIVVTWLATDTAAYSAISGFPSGRWYLYADPNGVEDGDSRKVAGGGYTMNPLGAVT